MSLYDLIMQHGGVNKFSADDWRALGQGMIDDQETIDAMLAEGYENMEDDDV